ncbi:MAG: hypothetical protein DMG97_41915, partial [Acidobacteria bacterium]
PLAGSPADLEVSLSAKATSTTEFRLVSERGETIRKLQMHPINSDREWLELTGSLEVPQVPFRIAVNGRDLNGKPYQRFIGRLFHGESIEVIPKLDFDELPVGSTKHALFTLRNVGATRTFRVTVTDTRGFLSKVQPSTLEIGSGESAHIIVDLTVPAGADTERDDDVVVVVSSTGGLATSNSAVVQLSVTQPGNN